MEKKKPCIVTITDGISPTSMPFNEFILYRLEHYPGERQILIQFFKRGVDNNIKIPSNVEYYSLGLNLYKIYNTIRLIERNYMVKVYHIHEGKSVILFALATWFRYRKRTIYTLHSTYRNYPLHNKLFSFCASLIVRDVVCVSKTSYKYYPNWLKKLRGEHTMYIQNGVDTERVESVKIKQNFGYKIFTMVYVARLVPLKRHYMLLEALQKLPSIKLKLIGIGPLEGELKQQIYRLEISEQVEFLGLLPREEVYRILKSSDLYVSSSSYEGLPIGVLEAMSCGIPCLVSDIEQHQEIADKCSSLFLCPDDIEEWVHWIKKLANMSSEERRCIGNNNKADVEQHFSLAAMHKKYDALYSAVQ